jgi:hypothetical protein
MRTVARLVGLGVLAYGVTRVWSMVQELWLRMDAKAKEEADLIAARDLDAELVGRRADDRAISARGGPSPSRDPDPGPAASD